MSADFTLLLILVIYDVSISMLSMYSFFILILRPYIKNRNKKKNGVLIDLSLYDNGVYRGAMSFNFSDLIDFVFKEIGDINKDKNSGVNDRDKR